MMTDKRFNVFLIGAIFITAALLSLVHFIPEKRLLFVPVQKYPIYLEIQPLPDGRLSSEWTNAEHTAWNCYWPENFHPGYFPCAWTLDLAQSREKGEGVDFSKYEDLMINLKYTGPANKV